MIYIAAPYNHPDKQVIQDRMETIYTVIGDYIRSGRHVITPLFMHEIVIRHDLDGTYDYWESFCLDVLKRCDRMVVLRMDGWDVSTGVAAEIQFCTLNNIPVEYRDVD